MSSKKRSTKEPKEKKEKSEKSSPKKSKKESGKDKLVGQPTAESALARQKEVGTAKLTLDELKAIIRDHNEKLEDKKQKVALGGKKEELVARVEELGK